MASGLHKKVKDWPKTRPRAILDIIAAVDGIVSPNPCRQILFFGSSKCKVADTWKLLRHKQSTVEWA